MEPPPSRPVGADLRTRLRTGPSGTHEAHHFQVLSEYRYRDSKSGAWSRSCRRFCRVQGSPYRWTPLGAAGLRPRIEHRIEHQLCTGRGWGHPSPRSAWVAMI